MVPLLLVLIEHNKRSFRWHSKKQCVFLLTVNTSRRKDMLNWIMKSTKNWCFIHLVLFICYMVIHTLALNNHCTAQFHISFLNTNYYHMYEMEYFPNTRSINKDVKQPSVIQALQRTPRKNNACSLALFNLLPQAAAIPHGEQWGSLGWETEKSMGNNISNSHSKHWPQIAEMCIWREWFQ